MSKLYKLTRRFLDDSFMPSARVVKLAEHGTWKFTDRQVDVGRESIFLLIVRYYDHSICLSGEDVVSVCQEYLEPLLEQPDHE